MFQTSLPILGQSFSLKLACAPWLTPPMSVLVYAMQALAARLTSSLQQPWGQCPLEVTRARLSSVMPTPALWKQAPSADYGCKYSFLTSQTSLLALQSKAAPSSFSPYKFPERSWSQYLHSPTPEGRGRTLSQGCTRQTNTCLLLSKHSLGVPILNIHPLSSQRKPPSPLSSSLKACPLASGRGGIPVLGLGVGMHVAFCSKSSPITVSNFLAFPPVSWRLAVQ